MPTIETSPGISFTGSKEYIAGAILAASAYDSEIFLSNKPLILQFCIGGCQLLGCANFTLSDVKPEYDLLQVIQYVSGLSYLKYPGKRFIHAFTASTDTADVLSNIYCMFHFNTMDFIGGINDAVNKYKLHVLSDCIIDTLDYTIVI